MFGISKKLQLISILGLFVVLAISSSVASILWQGIEHGESRPDLKGACYLKVLALQEAPFVPNLGKFARERKDRRTPDVRWERGAGGLDIF